MATIDRRALLGLLLAGLAVGCTRYPEASTKESLTYIAALRTACSSKNAQRLDKVEKAIEKAAKEGKLTEAEAGSFRRIIARARDGKWQRAEDECVSFQWAQRR